jgi:methylated-DNA-[protein]-cysteine S-methyltransferase
LSFKERVHSVVKSIPKGEVRTYKDVAKMAGNASAARAVGQILKKNFDPEIPCHRVIGTKSLGGYNRGRAEKLRRLTAENASIEHLLD